MNWGKLIADNFDKVLVIIGTLLGGVLGGGITYFVQSRLQGRQRRWALDDQRREWRREQYENLRDQVAAITSLVWNYSLRLMREEEDINEYTKLWAQLDTSAFLFDNEVLDILYSQWKANVNSLWRTANKMSPEDNVKHREKVISYGRALQTYINEIVEETYAPSHSLAQRIIKRLTPKRSKNKRSS
jgi:hypothetical protein